MAEILADLTVHDQSAKSYPLTIFILADLVFTTANPAKCFGQQSTKVFYHQRFVLGIVNILDPVAISTEIHCVQEKNLLLQISV